MEYNQFGNAPRAPALKAALSAVDIIFTIWMTRSGQPQNDFDFTAATARQACIESGCDGFVAEGEIPAQQSNGSPNPQAQNWAELVLELADLKIGKAVATNWAPFVHGDGSPAPEFAKVLIQDGWHCLPYVYPSEHVGITPERQAQYALHFTHEQAPTVLASGQGWYETEPVLGVFGGFDLSDFPTKDNYIGWSAYAAEYVI